MKNRLFSNNKWVIDLLIIVVIIFMGMFIFYRVRQMIESHRNSQLETKAVVGDTQDIETDMQETDIESASEDTTQSAKDFELLNLDGELIALSDYHGKPVMVNLWATWCPPCRAEMPLIQKYAEANQENLVVLAVNAGEEKNVVQNFVQNQNLQNLTFLLDQTESVTNLYRIPGYPTSLFVDSDGMLQGMFIGELDEKTLASYLEKIGIN